MQEANDYLVIRTSFEGIGDAIFDNEEVFSSRILGIFARELKLSNEEYADELSLLGKGLTDLDEVSRAICRPPLVC